MKTKDYEQFIKAAAEIVKEVLAKRGSVEKSEEQEKGA
ncbi:hypothetical protein PASE110613_07200 [Paenibacillus sediminis]|uniref:Uncharacterized protein n=1 Tax=Paenibacillus sediminis TaxID=664909 RepID=A0ABS4H3L4_9BACL|nr:hypothetical protein [Paenibacillus sediminis]